MGIQVKNLIARFQQMYEHHWGYIWGRSDDGCVDCSGAFVNAYRNEGKKISHGSNTIARKYISGGLLPISCAARGMAAFKSRVPGEAGYDLPDKFKPGGASYTGDLNDHYHIGLVDDDPRFVLNAKGTQYGFCRDELTAKNGWDYVAYLKDVDYDDPIPDQKEGVKKVLAKVVLPADAKGETVNMRKQATKTAELEARVPVGAEVDILTDQGQWCRIDYLGRQGWMMSNYLEYVGQGGESGGDTLSFEDREAIENTLGAMEDNLNGVRQMIELIREKLGRG